MECDLCPSGKGGKVSSVMASPPPAKKLKLTETVDEKDESCSAKYASSVHCGGTRITKQLLELEERLCVALKLLIFPPSVTHVYNPLSYASVTHACYITRYAQGHKKILFLGMNPGPFGMAQNGVCNN